ncbi:MAG: T9SS type A sorting domain-containing protein [candidate division Zixibacteria bacterium]|nr:T9SS type A sorting domain-containing protein [candidate division Zixibacteria bacterium]
MRRIVLIIIILVLGIPLSTFAEWPVGGVQLSGTVSDWGLQWDVVTDGEGGAWIVWTDPSDDLWDIRVQHIDNEGNLMFELPGLKVVDDPDVQQRPNACSDMRGGMVLCWEDYRSGSRQDPYAQRIDRNGNIMWDSNGIPIILHPNEQFDVKLKTNSTGYTIFAWTDVRGTQGIPTEVYAQCFDIDGNRQWDSLGLLIAGGNDDQFKSDVSMDSSGFFYITWQDQREDSAVGGIYAQKIDSNGDIYWDEAGIRVGYGLLGDVSKIYSVTIDGHGGLFFSWYERHTGQAEVYTGWIDSLESVPWGLEGIQITNVGAWKTMIEYDGFNGAYISWKLSVDEHRIQKIKMGTIEEALQWEENGRLVMLNNDSEPTALVNVSDGEWILHTSSGSGNFSQKFDTTGQNVWDINGKNVWQCRDYTGVTDNEGGTLVFGGRSYKLWAQRIYSDGHYAGETAVFDDFDDNIPSTYLLHNPYPNPFNFTTTLKYSIPVLESGNAIVIYNLLGQRIDEIRILNGNLYGSVLWDASEFASGIYFARLNGAHASNVIKLVLMK